MANDEDRISLHGHDPEDILRALLKVDPDSEIADEGTTKPDQEDAEKRTQPSE